MSRTLFFYGTLCHAPLLDCVLGAGDRGGQGGRVEAAVLDDHLVTWVHGQPFPMIRAEAGAQARGAVLRDVSDQDLARLIFYEGGFDYDLSPVSVQVGAEKVEAEVFFPQPGLWTPGAPWALQDWVDAWGAISLSAAGEVMEQFGTRSAEDIAHLLPFFRARGWARQMAQTSAPRQLRRDLHRNQVRITPRPASAKGFFRLESFALDYPKFDGTRSETIARNAYVAFDAALLLPYDPVSDRVMLVEQLRFGPLMRGDPYPSILEPIAGLVDAGEVASVDWSMRARISAAMFCLSRMQWRLWTAARSTQVPWL